MSRLLILFLLVAGNVSVCMAADALVDPTRPPGFAPNTVVEAPKAVQAQAENSPLALSSVLIGKSRKVAIINGKLLHRGDVVNGYRVERIQKNAVGLNRNGEQLTLKLRTKVIRQAMTVPSFD